MSKDLEKALNNLALDPFDLDSLEYVLSLYRRNNIYINFLEKFKDAITFESSIPIEEMIKGISFLLFKKGLDINSSDFQVTIVDLRDHRIRLFVEECNNIFSCSEDGKWDIVTRTFEPYFSGSISFDGDTHFTMGDGESAIYFCASEGWINHISLMAWIWENIPKLIPGLDKNSCGPLNVFERACK